MRSEPSQERALWFQRHQEPLGVPLDRSTRSQAVTWVCFSAAGERDKRDQLTPAGKRGSNRDENGAYHEDRPSFPPPPPPPRALLAGSTQIFLVRQGCCWGQQISESDWVGNFLPRDFRLPQSPAFAPALWGAGCSLERAGLALALSCLAVSKTRALGLGIGRFNRGVEAHGENRRQ